MRLEILEDKISPEVFVKMETEALASKDIQKKRAERKQYEMQAARSDAYVEKEANRKDKVKGDYICSECKSDNVNQELRQTRAADEPMTEFYTCLACGHAWRIYP